MSFIDDAKDGFTGLDKIYQYIIGAGTAVLVVCCI